MHASPKIIPKFQPSPRIISTDI